MKISLKLMVLSLFVVTAACSSSVEAERSQDVDAPSSNMEHLPAMKAAAEREANTKIDEDKSLESYTDLSGFHYKVTGYKIGDTATYGDAKVTLNGVREVELMGKWYEKGQIGLALSLTFENAGTEMLDPSSTMYLDDGESSDSPDHSYLFIENSPINTEIEFYKQVAPGKSVTGEELFVVAPDQTEIFTYTYKALLGDLPTLVWTFTTDEIERKED